MSNNDEPSPPVFEGEQQDAVQLHASGRHLTEEDLRQKSQDSDGAPGKENAIGQLNSYLHKSQSYAEMQPTASMASSVKEEEYKKAKGSKKVSGSKDAKIVQTMKAYFPSLAQVKEKKKQMFPPPNPNRSSTTAQPKLLPYSERIVFAEGGKNKRRLSAMKQKLPPIERKRTEEEKLNLSAASPQVLSPQAQAEVQEPRSEKKVLNYKVTGFQQRGEEDMVVAVSKEDYEKKNQERIQKMQEKKAMEMKMIEEERLKMIKRQEKLKQMILKQAAEHRERRQQYESQREEEKKEPLKATPTKKKSQSVEVDDAEKKQKLEIMHKYYRSRYSTFLKALNEQNKKREKEVEELRRQEEKRKLKLKEELGVANVQSRFKEEGKGGELKAERLRQILEEEQEMKTRRQQKRVEGKKQQKRGSSLSNFMTNTSTRFRDDSDLPKQKANKSQTRKSRALTPKHKKRAELLVAEPIDEDPEEKARQRKEAAEKIKLRQQKYLQELQERKEKEAVRAKEEKKKKERAAQLAREQAKQNFEKVQNQPGLQEVQKKEMEDEGDEEEKQKKKKKKQAKENPIDNFLERNNPKRTTFPNITDMVTWKKKHKVEESTKVFICKGGYPDIKKALKRRGWVENKDGNSPCFDLKWVLKSKEIDHNELKDHQLANHFNKACAITTKVGLCHNLKNLIWFNNVDIDTFYPRCFDLAIQDDLEDFISEFKAVKAEGYLKTFVRELRDSGETTVDSAVLKVAIRVCERRLKDLDDLVDEGLGQLVSDEEWRVLAKDEMDVESLAQKKHLDWMQKNEVAFQKQQKEKEKRKEKKKKKRKEKKDGQLEEGKEEEGKEEEKEEEEEDVDEDAQLVQKYPEFPRVVKILEGLKQKFPQFQMNGEKNIWIIKPAGSSRGRGIVLYKQLVEILDLCKSKESQFIAQKYIENPLIIKHRKFDIRQWVLVTDWNPLTIWLFNEPYFRFPATDYDPDNIADRFIHLTNNSVAKYAEGSKVTSDIEGNMMALGEVQEWLLEEFGWDVWEDKLREQSKNIVINCLESVQDMFECKKGCFELFGFDLMVDDDFNMWLIEVNSSPAMDYSTRVTERLVKLVLEDTVKVVVDFEQAKKKSKVDTGLLECIYKAKRVVEKPMQSFGLNLMCEGRKIAQNKLQHY